MSLPEHYRVRLEHYRVLYEYEKDCNAKMLTMLESVPQVNRDDARFRQAVILVDHLATCRERWLAYMKGEGSCHTACWNKHCDLATLRPRFTALESQWTDYLAHLTDYLAHLDEEQLAQDFEFTELNFEFTESNGKSYRLPIEVQIIQLMGQASYDRGQVILLIDQLGGETVDTDYADWWRVRQDNE
jgi:uncharacterized damage-inducible protein DinB